MLQIPYYKKSCSAVCVHFPFSRPFLSNHLINFDQSWQKDGYCQCLYRSQKSGLSVTQYGFYTIKTDCVSVRASVRPIFNTFFSATAGPILTKLGMKMNIDSGFMNQKITMISHIVWIPYYKKSCPNVSIFLSVAHFSATAWPIWTMLGRKMSVSL